MRKIYVFVLALLFCGFNNLSAYANQKQVFGIDVSRYQGQIDWYEVSLWENKKIDFVYMKATEGATLTDHTYQRNLEGAKQHKLKIGSYHFFRAKVPAKEQFKNFTSLVKKEQQDLIPIVDVELINGVKKKEFHLNFQTFLDMLEEHFGKKPLIYTSNHFYNTYLLHNYKAYKFLIGRYSEKNPIMVDGHDWTVWQYTESGEVNGISNKVDLNILNEKFNLFDLMLN